MNSTKDKFKHKNPHFGNTVLDVVCFIFGHRYKVTKRITKSISELQCKRCKKEFGINTSCESLLPLDKELKELHKSFSNYS